jgi:ADP-ribosyl-[dinitrogen reductase] hydrolase
MALLLAESLVLCVGFDPCDQMRRYLSWYKDGHLSSTLNLFDIGIQTRMSVLKFEEDPSDPFPTSSEEKRAGNGSLMRLAPISVAFGRRSNLMKLAADSSRTTHGAKACVDACMVYATMMAGAINGVSKEELLASNFFADYFDEAPGELVPEIAEVIAGSYKTKEPPEIEVRARYDWCLRFLAHGDIS